MFLKIELFETDYFEGEIALTHIHNSLIVPITCTGHEACNRSIVCHSS